MTDPIMRGRSLGEPITVADALLEYADLIHILQMREAGWVFRQLVTDAGELDGIVGLFHRQQYSDALWVFDLSDTTGVRILDEDYGDGVVWRKDGSLVDVSQELRELPEPEHRLAPRLVRASSLLWVP